MKKYKFVLKEDLQLKKIDFKSVTSDEWNVIQDVIKFVIDTLNENYDGYDNLDKFSFTKLVSRVMKLNNKEPYINWKNDVSEMFDRIKEKGTTL